MMFGACWPGSHSFKARQSAVPAVTVGFVCGDVVVVLFCFFFMLLLLYLADWVVLAAALHARADERQQSAHPAV